MWAHTRVDMALVEKAIDVIKDYYGPTRRKTGEPYYLHPLAVAHIVRGYTQDKNTILAALLHDIIAKTPLNPEQITTLFNKEVSDIVTKATNMTLRAESAYSVTLTPLEHVNELVEKEDKRVLYIKVAAKLHDMRTIHGIVAKERLALIDEAVSYYAPMAGKLGLKQVEEEFKKITMEFFDQCW